MKNHFISETHEIIYYAKGYKPLCFIEDKILCYKKNKFYLMDLNTIKMLKIVNFKTRLMYKVMACFRILVRLFRLEPRAAQYIENENSVYFGFKGKLYKLDLNTNEISVSFNFRKGMSAPLFLTEIKGIDGFNDQICFGEYFQNKKNEVVKIFSKFINDNEWKVKYTFPAKTIDHIHLLKPDYHRKCVWITTGDFVEAPGIWCATDNFKKVELFVGAEQKYRTCAFFPVKTGMIYATDTPLENNFIYHVSDDKLLTKLYELDGSVIYSAEFDGKCLLATTVEGSSTNNIFKNLFIRTKGPGIKSWKPNIILGTKEEGFHKIGSFEKDYFSQLFQFGTVTFPSGKNNTDKIICYGNALKFYDGKLMVLSQKKD